MKNLNNGLNSIITDSIPLYFKDFISLQDDTKEFLSNVKGAKETKKELKELFHFFKNPRQYQDMGIKVPKGYLFYGHPGTGKTFLAKELSKEAGVKFLYRSGSEFQQDKYIGTGVNKVMELFKEAKESNQPCIIFIDEIDAVGAKRSDDGSKGGSGAYDKTLNQLLTELDGFNSKDRDPSKPILVIGATNRPDVLDKALLRPERLERKLKLDLPKPEELEEFLDFFVKDQELHNDIKDQNGKLKPQILKDLSQKCYDNKFSPVQLKL
ncbi:AAA family ATPase [Chrysanthemum yellows phytoplasma]|uniref:AAA family ATPase n=1 Tax=Chrysanthemum yellows phytoplasma TaxID=238674 RepID=UPI0006904B90|nr:AAA family ATPase [Chrysanthemum yellows phytoplasma]